MFDANTYRERRAKLREELGSGLVLFLGNEESPMNYPANPFHFRQDSSFLYFFGLDYPSLAGIIDADEGKDIVFGDDVVLQDILHGKEQHQHQRCQEEPEEFVGKDDSNIITCHSAKQSDIVP